VTRILGIDPGSQNTGFGIIDVDGSHHTHVHSGRLRIAGASLPDRLGFIFSELYQLMDQWHPDEAAIENVFMARNADSALKLGQARGAAICAMVQQGLAVAEYSPREIKQSVVGKGSAAKEQVQHMVRVMLNLSEPPQADQADALGVAICHAHMRASLNKVAGARAVRGGRYR
jgi:crossover junction endodeoxyribonuclease RuvC